MKKTVLSIAVAAAVAIGLAACTSAPASSNSTGADSNAPGPSALRDAKGTTEITIWHGLGAANGAAFQKAIDDFNSTNTDHIHVTAAYQGVYADLLAKYTAALRSKSAPTIMLAGDIATGYMTDVKQSIPAAHMAKANPKDLRLGDLSSAATSYYKVDGVQQAVPMNVSTPVVWVNRNILRQAGIPDTAPLTTLDEVIAAAKTIKEKTGIAGFSMPDDDWYLEQLTASAGQDFCTPGNGRNGKAASGITINTGLAKENIAKIADLYRSGVAVDGAPDGSTSISAFKAAKVGLILNGSGLLGVLKKGTDFGYQALPFPTSGPKGTSGNVIGGSALWLNKSATPAQQVAGWKLETYLASPTVQEEFSHATGYIPINNKTAQSPSQKAYLAANPNSQVFIDQVKNTPVVTATAGCVSGAMTAIRTGDINQLQATFNGQKSVDDALNAAATSAKSAIANYRAQLGQ